MKFGNNIRVLETFGQRLKDICRKNGIKQEELSKAVNYSADTISNWYRDKAFPDTKENLSAIIHFLRDEKHIDVSLDYLLCLEDSKTHDAAFVMEYTGLSESAVQRLHQLKYESDFDKREKIRESEMDQAVLDEIREKGEDSACYVFSSDLNDTLAKEHADRTLNLLSAMLEESKESHYDELLSLMGLYVFGDIQNIAYYNSSETLQQDVLSGYIMAFDTADNTYRIKTTDLIRPHLADRIIDCLKEIAEKKSANDHHVFPVINSKEIIDI